MGACRKDYLLGETRLRALTAHPHGIRCKNPPSYLPGEEAETSGHAIKAEVRLEMQKYYSASPAHC